MYQNILINFKSMANNNITKFIDKIKEIYIKKILTFCRCGHNNYITMEIIIKKK